MTQVYVIPGASTAKELGKVSVEPRCGRLRVQFTVLIPLQGADAEGWRTAIALDASSSMQDAFGRRLLGKVPDAVLDEYQRKGWVEMREADGRQLRVFKKEAYDDAIAHGHLRFTDNLVQPVVRDLLGYLSGDVDAAGKTTLIYWACGDGSGIEVAGEFDATASATVEVVGPVHTTFGTGTRLRPALELLLERHVAARRSMLLFVTDGRIDDLDAVVALTQRVTREISSGARNQAKCVLIGVGARIAEDQMDTLDHLDTGTDIDLWDCKKASELRSLTEIFAEVVDEQQIVAPAARIFAADGSLAKAYTDGLPALVRFEVPLGCPWFELEVGGRRIRQALTLASSA